MCSPLYWMKNQENGQSSAQVHSSPKKTFSKKQKLSWSEENTMLFFFGILHFFSIYFFDANRKLLTFKGYPAFR